MRYRMTIRGMSGLERESRCGQSKRMIPRRTLAAGLCSLSILACASPPSPDGDLAAAQLAAATRIAADIARRPGPLQVVCVAYSGDWEDPPLPTEIAPLTSAYADGCEEVDGQLFAREGGARAIWVGVGEPEMGSASAVVPVFTSTGIDDATSYRCAVGRRGSEWVVEDCEMGAVG